MANESDIIKHLSSEITSSIQKMSEFRSKTNLAIFLGPYILLGALVVRQGGFPKFQSLTTVGCISIIVMGICFLLMGILVAIIEKHD